MDTSPPRFPVAEGLARASAMINTSRSFQGTPGAIVHATRTSLPEFGHVSISVKNRQGTFETEAGTDQLVWELDGVQYDLGEGAVRGAVEAEPVVVVEHLRHDTRWPRYVPAAVERGARSQRMSRARPGTDASRTGPTT